MKRLECEGPVGCTLPAVVSGGTVRTAAHIDPSWIGANAGALFGRATGRSCTVINDADAAGVGEARFGAAAGRRGVVMMVTVGTGLGTALLNDGELVPNSELGHLEVNGHIGDVWASDAARERKQLSWKLWAARLDEYLKHLHAVLWPELIVWCGAAKRLVLRWACAKNTIANVATRQRANRSTVVNRFISLVPVLRASVSGFPV